VSEALPYGRCSTSAPQSHATGCLLGFEQAPCIQILMRFGNESSRADFWQRSENLPGVRGPIFPHDQVLNLRSPLCISDNPDSVQLLHLSNLPRGLCSCDTLPMLSLCPVGSNTPMRFDLSASVMLMKCLWCTPLQMRSGTSQNPTRVTWCSACTSSTTAGFHRCVHDTSYDIASRVCAKGMQAIEQGA